MDWNVFASTFLAIFLAELGDKTQLATLSFAAGTSSRLAVFGGAALALVATSAVAVLVGEGLGRVVPGIWLRRTAGAGFMPRALLKLERAAARGERLLCDIEFGVNVSLVALKSVVQCAHVAIALDPSEFLFGRDDTEG